jgi:hypothetical protein
MILPEATRTEGDKSNEISQKTFEDYASKDNAKHQTSNIEVFPLL